MIGILSSCSAFDDFLTVYPTNQITGEQFWEDKTDLESVVFSCYKQLTKAAMARRMFVWGEARSDNFMPRTADDEDMNDLMNANLLSTNAWFNWSSIYTEIGYCNLALSKGAEIVAKDASFSEGDWLPIEVELKTLRALSYFYLVRTFRDVPFNVTSTDTSVGVREPVAATSSEEILTFLINDLESVKDNGMTNYGNNVDNRGRITRNAVYTLLADLYLWRAAKNASADSASKYPGQSEQDYLKCIECCDYVIAAMNELFRREGQEHYGSNNVSLIELPLLVTSEIGRLEEIPYNSIFGSKNSLESIFEVQYSATGGYNNVVPKYLGGWSSGRYATGDFMPSGLFSEISNQPDNTINAYSKTDLRTYETFQFRSVGVDVPTNFAKYIMTSVTTENANDLTANSVKVTYSGQRQTDFCDANYIIYRASEVVLMKAEAMACIYKRGDAELFEAFNLATAVFNRSNPKIESSNSLKYEDYSDPSLLYDFILRERQREFYAEGKRWFDLVRLALHDGNTNTMLGLLGVKYQTNASAIKAKMATLNSLYSPYYKNEMKVNTLLIQNPAWPDNETSERN